MRKIVSLFLCTLLTGLAQQGPESTVTFKSQSNLVVINVFARDKDGKPVSGLKKSDFILTENGVPQEVSVFEFQKLSTDPIQNTTVAPMNVATTNGNPGATTTVTTGPSNPPSAAAKAAASGSARYRDRRLMVFFFDLSSMQPSDQIRAQKAAKKFVDENLTTSDLVEIMTFGNKLSTDLDFTDDRDLLQQTIRKIKLGEASTFAADGATSDEAAEDDSGYTADDTEFNIFNTDRKLSALEEAVRGLGALPERKALIYFTGGVSKTGTENESQLRSTVNAAIRANVSFYSVDVRGLQATPPGGDASTAAPRGTNIYTGLAQTRQRDKFHASQDTLVTLAGDTGGKALLDNNDLSVGIQAAQQDLQSYYILGYYSSNTAQDGKFRRVNVKLGPGVQAKIDYRSGYFGQKNFKNFNSTDKERQLEEALLLGDPATDLSLVLEVDQFRLDKNRFFVPVAVKIPGSQIPLAKKGKSSKTEFDFIGQVRDDRGLLVASVRDAIPIKLPETAAGQLSQKSLTYDTGFTLAPGTYTLKLLTRENQSGKMGTFETKFSVPEKTVQANQLQISSVVWASQREPLAQAVGGVEKQNKAMQQHPLVHQGQKLIPSITRLFRTDQNLYVYLEAYDPTVNADSKQPSLMASVSFFRGKQKAFETAPVHLSEQVPARPGTIPLELQLSLKSLPPGKYTCQVNVIDEVGRKFAFERTPIVVAAAAVPAVSIAPASTPAKANP